MVGFGLFVLKWIVGPLAGLLLLALLADHGDKRGPDRSELDR